MAAGDPTSNQEDRSVLFRQMVVRIVGSLPPEVENAVYLCAVPRFADADLLEILVGEEETLNAALDFLQRTDLARLDIQKRLHIRAEVREILLTQLLQTSEMEYKDAHSSALEYFTGRSAVAEPFERPVLEREELYHQLVVNESVALRRINELLEEIYYYRRSGAAELMVDMVVQHRRQLSEEGRNWARYFKASLEIYRRNRDFKSETLEKLGKEASDPLLQALSAWKLGQWHVFSLKWSTAVACYTQSLSLLEKTEEKILTSRVWMSMAIAYSDLAERSGGGTSGLAPRPSYLRRFLLFCQHLPYLLLEWLVRHVSFLPRLYFGTNYQDWIIERLMIVSSTWARRAEQSFSQTKSQSELVEARLTLARLEHRIGRWSRANRRYELLENDPFVLSSQYRLARLRLGQGRASLDEGRPKEAIGFLEESASIFLAFDDPDSIGKSNFLLGRAYYKEGQTDRAVRAFLSSAAAYEESDDSLFLTRVLWSLEEIAQQNLIPEILQGEIFDFLERVHVRHSITRFPDRILKRYRQLALLVALPISYLLVALIGYFSVFLLLGIETTILNLISGVQLPVVLVTLGLGFLILPILLALWIFRGVYSLVGFISVYILGRQLEPLEREQPANIIMDQNEIRSYRTRLPNRRLIQSDLNQKSPIEQELRMAWMDIKEAFTVEYLTISRPIGLISRLFLRDGVDTLVVDGVAGGYAFLESEIIKALSRLKPAMRLRVCRFTFLERWSTLITLVLAFSLAAYLYSIRQIEVSGEILVIGGVFELPVGTLVQFTIWTMLRVLPAVMLWRLLLFRLRVERAFGKEISVTPTWIILLAALIGTAIGVEWIVFLITP